MSPMGFVIVVVVVIACLYLFLKEREKLRSDYEKYKNTFRQKQTNAQLDITPGIRKSLSPEMLWRQLETLNFAVIEAKVRETEKRWGDKRVASAMAEYKKFLYLFGISRDEAVVPQSIDVDKVWHQHILQMKKYEYDCQVLFGKTLYHNPLDSGTKAHTKGVEHTQTLYRRSFTAPSNAPSTIVANYDSSGGMPWWLWWSMYSNQFGTDAGVYETSSHSFRSNDTDPVTEVSKNAEYVSPVVSDSHISPTPDGHSFSSPDSSNSPASSCSGGSPSCSSGGCSSS